MIINTKFTIKNKLYTIYKDFISEKCWYCNKTGKITIKNKQYYCPVCNGNKVINDKIYWKINNKRFPNKIFIEINRESKQYIIEYAFYCKDSLEYFNENDCFLTKKEAEIECEKRNKLKD